MEGVAAEPIAQALSEPDAIFMPNALETVKEFLKVDGNKPEDAVRLLASGFRGYADMCNLLAAWSEDAGCAVEEIQGTLVKTVADRVKAVYDPQCTRGVFQARNANVPWMSFMVTKPLWRSVLYELAEVHKADAVLGLALSTIEKLGHQDELATILLGFKLFNQALVQSVSKMLGFSEQKLVEELPKFKKMCAQSPNTYLYTQLVLLRAVETTGASGVRLMRLFWELHDHVVAEHKGSKVVSRLGYLLMGVLQYKELATGLFVMLENGKTNPADMSRIHRAFTQQENRPPVWFLHNGKLLEMLVDDLFVTGREVPSSYLDKYVYCLAYATSPSANEGEGDDGSRLAEVIKAIETASMVAKKNFFGSELDRYTPLLHHYVASFPVVCMGLLSWIRSNMCDRSYYEKGTHSLSLGRFVSLVLKIAATQIKLRLHCVDVLKTAYETVETSQTEEGMAGEAARVKTELLDGVVQLLLTDDGQVATAIVQWMEGLVSRASTDTAIVRHFVKALLGCVLTPFSAVFVEFVAGLLAHAIPENSNYTYVQQLMKIFAVPGGGPSVVDSFLQEAHKTAGLSDKARTLLATVQTRIAPPATKMTQVTPITTATTTVSAPKPAAVVKSSTVIKIANLNPSLISRKEAPTTSATTATATTAKKTQPEKKKTAAVPEKKKPAPETKKKKNKRERAVDDDDEEDEDGDFELDEDEKMTVEKKNVTARRQPSRTSKPVDKKKTKFTVPAALLGTKKTTTTTTTTTTTAKAAKKDEEAFLEFSDE